MQNNAKTLRELVINNALTLGRVSKQDLGEDYFIMNTVYTGVLDALTEWASKDYAHKSTKDDIDNAFNNAKIALGLFATENDKIIIDEASMRTLRDCATKPKRLYSNEYKMAEKARKEQAKTVNDRYNDLVTLGAPQCKPDEEWNDYIARVEKKGKTYIEEATKIDMLAMFKNAVACLNIKAKAVEDIKAKGNWTWKRPVAVTLNEFAELFENYIADCLIDGYNIKPSKVVREEKKAEREANKKAK